MGLGCCNPKSDCKVACPFYFGWIMQEFRDRMNQAIYAQVSVKVIHDNCCILPDSAVRLTYSDYVREGNMCDIKMGNNTWDHIRNEMSNDV